MALVRTELDARQFGLVRGFAALEQLEGSACLLLDTLAEEAMYPWWRGEERRSGAMASVSPPPCRDCGPPAWK
jgi:hypothetical protein